MGEKQAEFFMRQALDQAEAAFEAQEVPIGAVIVHNDAVIAKASNSCEYDNSPLAHAEIKAIMQATEALKNWRLSGCDLFVTLEPCPMCLGAIIQSRLRSVHFGCPDPKRQTPGSFFQSLETYPEITDNNHTLKVHSGILASECSKILTTFFQQRRQP